jgi:hypothetical protein
VDGCNFPNCPSGQLSKGMEEVLKEIKDVSTETRDTVKEQAAFGATLASALKNLDKLDVENRREHDVLFGKADALQEQKLSKRDMYWAVTVMGIIITVITSAVSAGVAVVTVLKLGGGG